MAPEEVTEEIAEQDEMVASGPEADDFVDEEIAPSEQESAGESNVESATEPVPKHDTGSVSPEASPVVPPAGEDPPPEFRNDQLAFGQAIGMTPEQVRAFGTPESFDSVMGSIANAMQTRQPDAQQQPQQQPQQQQQQQWQGQPAQHQQQVPPPAQQQPIRQTGDYTFEDPDDYDEGVVGMNQHNNGRFGQLEQQMTSLLNMNQQIMMESSAREFDSILNTKSEDIFGRGRLNELDESQAMNRTALADEVSRLGHGHIAKGEVVPPLEMLVERASSSLFSGQMASSQLENLSQKSQKLAGQASAPPTQTEAPLDRGTNAAVLAAAEWQREHPSDADEGAGGFLE
jgi:hypothetical protein